MEYSLTRPCPKCPFRTDVEPYLRRADEIAEDLERAPFICHETAHELKGDRSKPEQHCAGALIVLEREGQPHQMMRIMERLGGYDSEALDMEAPVFDSLEAFVDHHDAEAE